MAQGPAGPAPVQMRRGGIVQHFQSGSTDTAVTATPEEEPPSASERLRDAAQLAQLQILNQRPMAVPSLQSAMESRLPAYESLLGTGDKESMRSQMLFDIAQAALGFAGNVGPQGQPMRGSFASRAAQAFSGVPASISSRLAENEKQRQAVRLAALQAGEADIKSVRESNLALEKERRDMLTKMAEEGDSGWGTSLQGRSMAKINSLIEGFMADELGPAGDRDFLFAVTQLRQPQLVTDPLTGTQQLVPSELPPFVLDALEMRNMLPEDMRATGAPLSKGQQALEVSPNTPPWDADPLGVNPVAQIYFQGDTPSFWNAASGTGIFNTIPRGLARVPIIGNFLGNKETVEADTFLEAGKNQIVNGLRAETDRFTNAERQQILKEIDVVFEAIDTPEIFRLRLMGLDDLLQQKQREYQSAYNNVRLPAETRRDAASNSNTVHNIRIMLGVPPHVSSGNDPRLQTFLDLLPPGTPIYNTEGGRLESKVVPQRTGVQ
jgi:hypothetical protein